MNKEEVRKIAQRLRIPKYMRDTDSALDGLVKFAHKVAEIERESCVDLAEGVTAYTQFHTVEHYKLAAVIAAAIRERTNVALTHK